MKLAFVLPRYGADILGGAEQAARLLAESIVRTSDTTVEVFTTCAFDAVTFADAYAPGTTREAGVTVHRFPARGRSDRFDALSEVVLRGSRDVQAERAMEWIEAQGPVSPDLMTALAGTDADLVAFHPYLYHPTVGGMQVIGDRPAILHPATHAELPLALPVFDEVFTRADGIVFWTRSEQALANARFRIAATHQVVLGIGVEPGDGEPDAARASIGIGDAPFALCLGRVDAGKGAHLLVDLFAAYKELHPGPERLVLAGPVLQEPPEHPDVLVAGPVDEATKLGLLRAADVLISPSPLESFSIVLLEAWSAGTPVLVNGTCEPTRDHAAASNGGLWFETVGEFVGGLNRLFADPVLRTALAAQGAQYVARRYAQPVLTRRYLEFCTRVVAHRGARSGVVAG